ncbi:hypothetical protein D3C87_1782510 [compost metagenome]
MSTPELSSIGTADPAVPEILAGFWSALEELDAKGLMYNHSKNPDLLALSLPHLAKIFLKCDVRVLFTRDLRDALKRSRKPLYLEMNTVYSAIECAPKKCWIFKTAQ